MIPVVVNQCDPIFNKMIDTRMARVGADLCHPSSVNTWQTQRSHNYFEQVQYSSVREGFRSAVFRRPK